MIARVAVVVPAADEQDHIGACLRSLQIARRRLHFMTSGAVQARIVVVLDGCRDDTAAIVSRHAGVEVVVSTARCVGTARRLGVQRALALDAPVRELWLASTDADCVVPSDWLTGMLEHADRGINLVLGTVRPSAGLPTEVHAAWTAAHHERDDHPHVHAANLGIDARSYLALGGWRDLPSHEDADLVGRARGSGHLRIGRSGGIAVVTSSRLDGRVEHGFSSYLRELSAV